MDYYGSNDEAAPKWNDGRSIKTEPRCQWTDNKAITYANYAVFAVAFSAILAVIWKICI